ncbi:MAG: 3-oxoacid CoA-transferase subunit B [Alphaproteobacteria bacterium]
MTDNATGQGHNSVRRTPDEIAARIAQDIPDGFYVNLGIGQPEKVANHVPSEREVVLHSENGILGFGPTPADADIDHDLINAGKKPVTLKDGGSFFHHADSFAMIRGGHIDLCVLGAYQVAENGDLANWSTGKTDDVPGVGGAMDLAAGAKRIFVMMTHTTKDGAPKLVDRLTYPATARGVVKRVYTDLAVLDVVDGGFQLVEAVEGLSLEDLRARTGATIHTP